MASCNLSQKGLNQNCDHNSWRYTYILSMAKSRVRVVNVSHFNLRQSRHAHGSRVVWDHSAVNPLAGRYGLYFPQSLTSGCFFFIARASSRKCRFILAYMRSYAIETKERMLMYLHALERLNCRSLLIRI